MTADFSGYATRNNLRCSDGRTILADAFAAQNGETVPLVWQHGHDDPTNVLGHVMLENVADGVKAHAFFNQSEKAQHIKQAVQNGDVKFLSIFANQLKERMKQVSHGVIREVSLVLAGANPGATIDTLTIAHSDGYVETFDDSAHITTGLEIEVPELELAHADDKAAEGDDRTLADILETLNEEQSTAVNFLLSQALSVESDSVKHSDTDEDSESDEGADADDNGDDESSQDSDAADDEGTEQDAETAEADEAAETDTDAVDDDTDGNDSEDDTSSADSDTNTETEADDEAVQAENTTQEDTSMTHNLFDQSKDGSTIGGATYERKHLAHDALQTVLQDTIKKGSLKDALADHALAHGIENIEYLFPDAKLLANEPSWIARRVEWVDKVLGSVRKTPFSRIKTVHADITADEARARGYIKGNLKVEEFFTLMKRETTPQTVYKKQKLDRDDVLDITDLDVIAFVKAEMKLMLDEEIAGAILIGDGRSSGDEDKIKEDKIRPILTDAELYTTTYFVNLLNANSSIEEVVDKVIEARADYKGTGTPTFYCSPAIAAKFRNVKDNFGHRMYKNLKEVAEALDAMDVVPVEIFNRVPDLVGILVNLTDYAIGTDRGGQATMFDDFDLDYNKYRYLLETRLCGALTLPYSAQVFMAVAGANVELAQPLEPTRVGNVVTVPTVANVTYKNAETNATLTTGAPVTIATDDTLFVKAFANSGYNFPDNAHDEWDYEYEA